MCVETTDVQLMACTSVPAHEAALERLRGELRASPNEEDRVALKNFEEEDRVVGPFQKAFHEAVAASAGTPSSPRGRLRGASYKGACALPVPGADRAKIEALRWWTHVSWERLLPYLTRATDNPATLKGKQPKLSRPYGEYAVWITTFTSADPDEVRDRLGLADHPHETILMRVEIPIDQHDLFVPTALDSAGNPAWRRPPPGHSEPWGVTRDLRDDAPAEPELLTRTRSGDQHVAEYLGKVTTNPPDKFRKERLKP